MVIVLLNWLYVTVTVFGLGVGVAAFVKKAFGYRIKNIDSLLMAGLIVTCAYAQFFSLAYKVSLLCNVIMVIVALILLLWNRKPAGEYLSDLWHHTTWKRKLVVAVLVLIWAYFSSRGYIHYDSDLYHAQSIRWLEEYGVVPGLGNLHERFAYNSSSFALNALYSWAFMLPQSLHTMSGYHALVLNIAVLDIAKVVKRRRMLVSDFGCVAAIYYLTTITEEVVSPASDYSIMCVILWIVIHWLRILEEDREKDGLQSIVPYALLCVVGCYAVTLKLTAGLILIVLWKPATYLIKEKKWKDIGIYICMGLLVVAPWMIRTVVISGWLLYPFSALDIFNFDWEMSKEVVDFDSACVKSWGKAIYDATRADAPIREWFGNWFHATLSGTEKLLILADFTCIPVMLVLGIVALLKKNKELGEYFLVLLAMAASFLFWLNSAPLMRYGYSHVLLLTFITVGVLLQRIKGNYFVFFVISAYGVYKLFTQVDYIMDSRYAPYYLWQQDYNTYELNTYEVGGITFYSPVGGDRTGYESFPAAPGSNHIQLRGETLEEGFRR
ncbi:MAG: hypothetical protein IJ324_04000 [Lachnospiraceae bacterium]|nr:hypothetical protein [Lachnospiraceae bacterium]